MPVYEYMCDRCGNKFTKLIFNKCFEIECNLCGSKDVKKLMSAFSTSGLATSNASCSGCNSSHCSSCGH